MFFHTSGHPQFHNGSVKFIEEWFYISSSVCFTDQLWSWAWHETGRNR